MSFRYSLRSLLNLLMLCSFTGLFAQTATVRGFVYDKKNLESIPSASIQLTGTKYGVVTDVNGYFQLSGIPAGTYDIKVTFLGYDTVFVKITLNAGDIISKKFYLSESVKQLGTVEINVHDQIKQNEVNVSYIPVTVEDIKKIPSVGGEPDFAQYVQVLPGVTFTGDQGGQLYIRGGTPVQNKVLLDGMIVYNPFHSIGLFSVFDADIIRNADVYTGGFPAEYGGRISSIMDITTRDGNKKRIAGKFSASTFGAKTILEGPLFKPKRKKSIFNSSDEIRTAIQQNSGSIDSLNKEYRRMDSTSKVILLEKSKISANLLKIATDSNFKALAGPLNEQIKHLQGRIDSVNMLMKLNRGDLDKRNITSAQLNKELNDFDAVGGSSSFLLSAKTSYLDKTSKIIYPYTDTSGNGLPYSFSDFYGKTSFNSANGSKINLYGFNFNDVVNYTGISDLNWKSYGGGSNFVLVPSNSPILVEGAFAYSKYGITMTEADSSPRSSDINGFNMGLNFTYFKGNSDIKYGIEVLGFHTNFQFYNTVHRLIAQDENTTELGGYIRSTIRSRNKKIIMEPGFRLHYYASLREISPEPRLGVKWNAFEKVRFKFAGGLYSQNLLSATSDRDVVNLFYGFLSGPDNLQSQFMNEKGEMVPVKSHLQKAWHAIGGVEYDILKHLDLNVEAYFKDFTQLTNINRNKLFDDDADHVAVPDSLKKDFIVETGKARGIDFLLKYDYKHLYIWAVYSLGYVTRWDGSQEYVPHFDRRHNMNFVCSYTFGKNLDWEADVRWNLGSGFPFTKTAGFYENLVFADGINTNYTTSNYNPNSPTSNSQLGILYGKLNGGRLPYYHRLDVTIKKSWATGEESKLELAVGCTNVYNRANIFYFDRIRYRRVNQLPIMPSVNMTWNF